MKEPDNDKRYFMKPTFGNGGYPLLEHFFRPYESMTLVGQTICQGYLKSIELLVRLTGLDRDLGVNVLRP